MQSDNLTELHNFYIDNYRTRYYHEIENTEHGNSCPDEYIILPISVIVNVEKWR